MVAWRPFTLLMAMQRNRFRRLVLSALRTLPMETRAHLNNVEIVIEREPKVSDLSEDMQEQSLFGLYVGTPLVHRTEYHMALPARIVIFQGPLERAFRPSEIPKQVRITVLHEIAHHFGINDARLHELGYD